VSDADFADATLVLIGHGTALNEESAAPVRQHAAELRRRNCFAGVREAFWNQEPRVSEVVSGLTTRRVFLAPLFISEGYFSEQVIPKALGFEMAGQGGGPKRVLRRGDQTLFYALPVGTHDAITRVLLARAREVVGQFPFPRAPKQGDITLFVAGHGTEQNDNSRTAVERQVELVRAMALYAAVHALFMEEEPRIATCYSTAQTKNIVVVPFFISDGLHVREDIPVLLGEPERVVRQRLQNGQATWRNPTERHGKRVWYASAVGTEPLLAEVILERVRESSAWGEEAVRQVPGLMTER
jgi:sirohydrochlorin cobaltochelatase